jgi:chitin disaccharide deacetylase
LRKEVILHIDDIGISKSANRSALNLFQKWRATSGSIIVPWQWFEDIRMKKDAFNKYDIWVHLTLTSERLLETLKRKPTLPKEEVSSLINKDWYFLSNIDDILYKSKHEEIKKELINQILIAKNAWIEVSHIDSHMGVLLHKKLFHIYIDIANIFWLQPFIVKPKITDTLWNWFYDCDRFIDDALNSWFKIIDNFDSDSLYKWDKSYSNHCIERINSIKGWTTYFLLHVLDDHTNANEQTSDYILRNKEYKFFNSKLSDDIFKLKNINKITTKHI